MNSANQGSWGDPWPSTYTATSSDGKHHPTFAKKETVELKPCPFCGYKSRYTEIVFKEGQASISCLCGASMSIEYDAVSRDGFIRFYEDDSYAHELEKEILRKWNRRVSE